MNNNFYKSYQGRESHFQNILHDYEVALQKSNQNVQELKLRIYDLTQNENVFEEKINNYVNKLEEKENILKDKNDIISSLKKSIINSYNHNNSQENIITLSYTNLNNDENNDKNLNLKLIQENNKNKELESNLKMIEVKENKKKLKIEKLKEKLKNIKIDLKEELNEKIMLLKRFELMREDQIKENIINNNLNNDDNNCNNINNEEKLNLEKECSDLIARNENLHFQLSKLVPAYENLLKEKMEFKKKLELNYEDINKLENENFNLRCEINLLKEVLIQIAKLKLNKNKFENFLNLITEILYSNNNNDNNTSNILKDKTEEIINYFKKEKDDFLKNDNNILNKEITNYNNNYINKTIKLDEINKSEIINLINQYNNEKKLRRKLQNKNKSKLRVMCRIKPNDLINNDELINIQNNLNTIKIKDKKYELDYIFNNNNTQQDIYSEFSINIKNLINETNLCIFAYGQTSTGKSYSIEGSESNPGLLLRSARDIFKLQEKHLKNKIKISISIVEIYNDKIFNLLEEDTPILNLYENSNGNLNIPELHPVTVGNYEEVLKLLKLAQKMKLTKQISFDDRSNKSHCIYTFHLKYDFNKTIFKSKFHIIDLAGSDKIIKVNDENLRKEAISVNLSLNSLSNVLNSIMVNCNHIPFRDSKLTHFLKEAISDKFNILLLLHVDLKDLEESSRTFEFCDRIMRRAKNIKIMNNSKEKIRNYSYGPQKKLNKLA